MVEIKSLGRVCPFWWSIVFAVFGFVTAAIGQEPVKLSEEMLGPDRRIFGFPPGQAFDGGGMILASGRSGHFQTLPQFCLLQSRKWDPEAGVGYEKTQRLRQKRLPLEELYPLQLRDMESPSISNFTVIGMQPRELPWRVMKEMYEGDALHVKGCTGTVSVSSVYWENVEDGFGPLRPLDYWKLDLAYMRYIRDDAVENDDIIPGEITNCLVDGCFVFLSQRSEPEFRSSSVTLIRDCLVWVQSQPHDGKEGKTSRPGDFQTGDDGISRAPGMIFKWQPGGGTVDVRNCLFRMDAVSFNGPSDMEFPPGRYENVTLLWLGTGPYPAPLPKGVSLSRDVALWEKSRAEWLRRLPLSHPARR